MYYFSFELKYKNKELSPKMQTNSLIINKIPLQDLITAKCIRVSRKYTRLYLFLAVFLQTKSCNPTFIEEKEYMKHKDILPLKTVEEANKLYGFGSPKHPLVSVMRFRDVVYDPSLTPTISLGLYFIAFKSGVEGKMGYGRNSYDFSDGTMVFMSPGQVFESHDQKLPEDTDTWLLVFHPDLIRKHSLGKRINDYSFFSYDVHEALHLSDEEAKSLIDLTMQIEGEVNSRIDRHSQNLICSNIELLLDYCIRFYDRQFYTRSNMNQGVLAKFESTLNEYFESGQITQKGLPTVASIAQELSLSASYLSDMLKRETGKTGQEHIHFQLIEQAKTLLLNSNEPVSQIAYTLGFEYPQHFSKLFKRKVGMTPSAFRTTA